jgi:hypothetical protein
MFHWHNKNTNSMENKIIQYLTVTTRNKAQIICPYKIISYNGLCECQVYKEKIIILCNTCSTDIIKIPIQWNMYYMK